MEIPIIVFDVCIEFFNSAFREGISICEIYICGIYVSLCNINHLLNDNTAR